MSASAILTLAFYNNFGSVLQAFALQKKIQQITGGITEVVAFKPQLSQPIYFRSEDLARQYQKKCDLFDEFRSRYLGINGDWFSDIEQINKKHEYYITGSDIVWGKEFSGLSSTYFLDFVPKEKKRIAYAASMILTEDGKSEDDKLYAKYIPGFDAVSLRETSSVDFIQQFTDKKVVDVLDPTLLLEKKDYQHLVMEGDAIPDKPYLLAYFLTHDPAVVDYTNIMAKKLGLRVVHYFADYPNRIFDSDAGCFAFAGPEQFLGYVKHASCVFTNSFHGTCFAIIFQRPFYTYTARRAMLSRVQDLIGRLELENRCFTDFQDIGKLTLDIDYIMPNKCWKQEQDKSLEFLENAVGGNKCV